MRVCENYKIIPYESKYLDELSYQIMKFQRKAKTAYYESDIEYKTFTEKFAFFKSKTKDLINSCQYNDVVIDEKSNKIFGFWCFKIENGVCYVAFMFKSQEFKMNTTMFKASYEAFNGMKPLGFNEVHTTLSRKEKKYLNFLKRYYNITIKDGNPIHAIFHI
jgi:hypothetical protein